jgi:pimeloyl-ACP methyl ester carboxylesterase
LAAGLNWQIPEPGLGRKTLGAQTEFVELNGAALRYAVSGKGERTLVLVHEMGGSIESWDDIAPRFPNSRRVLRYDSRGAGMSQKVRGELAIDTMADDIAALLDHIGTATPVALAGVAVGGAIALHFAARYPERVSAAVGPATGVARIVMLQSSSESAGSRTKAWHSRSRSQCGTAIPASFAVTSGVLSDTGRDGSATIL